VILQNKNIIIMGGTSGMGWAAAKKFVAEGACVLCVGKPQDTDLNDEQISIVFADAREEETMFNAIQLCIEKFGSFDGLFHVAGGSGRSFGDGPLHEMSIDGWKKTIELNATTIMLSNKAAIDHFLKQKKAGAIVNLSSVLALHPAPSFFSTHAYAAAKAAIAAGTQGVIAGGAATGTAIGIINAIGFAPTSGIAIFNTCLYISGHYTTAINMALISTTSSPIFATAFAIIFIGERINAFRLTGMLICLFGVLLLISKGSLQTLLSFTFSVGDIWALAGAIAFAVYNVLVEINALCTQSSES
jgi:NAD(P)-dependent dehydrogenase (short-subunit alcohol dehydrogenase family)